MYPNALVRHKIPGGTERHGFQRLGLCSPEEVFGIVVHGRGVKHGRGCGAGLFSFLGEPSARSCFLLRSGLRANALHVLAPSRERRKTWPQALDPKTFVTPRPFAAAATAGDGWGTAILHAWTEADQAQWAGVLNFWFLGRVFDEVRP